MDDFIAALSNEHCLAPQVGKFRKVKYLWDYLSDLKAETLVIEDPYTDGEYLEDYTAYYARCFETYPRTCKRLHFFSADLKADDIPLLISRRLSDAQTVIALNSYLGFIVARPLPEAIIGRTLLKSYPAVQGRNYRCTREFRPNFFGLNIPVDSHPYQEQDRVMAACATMALWSALQQTAHLFFGTGAPRPATITKIASQVVSTSRPIPSKGLDVRQMCNVISSVGLEPEVIHVKDQTPLLSLIYAYLMARIPVILGLRIGTPNSKGELHAITLNGFKLHKEGGATPSEPATSDGVTLIGRRIARLFAHDDQIGPFVKLFVGASEEYFGKTYPMHFYGSWEAEGSTEKERKYIPLYPEVVVVPEYGKIRLSFRDAYEFARRITSVLPDVFAHWPWHWEIRLSFSNDFKNALAAEFSGDSLPSFLTRPLPRFLWCVALRYDDARDPELELLLDATDIPGAYPVQETIWFNSEIRDQARLWFSSEPGNLDIRSELEERLQRDLLKEGILVERRAQGAEYLIAKS